MKISKWIAAGLAVCCVAALAGCAGNGSAVYVQSVAKLSGRGIGAGDRFSCMVVSESVSEIERDTEKTVLELCVKEGDDVKEGQVLFSYDTEELQLTLDKQKLEQEQLEASIENYKSEIAEMEKDRERAGTRDKLQYTVQIQTMQVDLKEAELNLKTKQAEVKQSKEILKNASVKSPVTGRVQAVSESGTDSNGNSMPYITIQKSGSFRVKGTIGELQRGAIVEGDRVKMISRQDESLVWTGTVSLVDYENPINNSNGNFFGGASTDEMSATSKYPFYINLDSSDGMILGQHLYLELDSGEETAVGLSVSEAFICFEDDGSAYVWADNGRNKLEKRAVTVGELDLSFDTYEVLSGLSDSDYIAFPDEEVCRSGAPTTRQAPAEEGMEITGGMENAANEFAMDDVDMEPMEMFEDAIDEDAEGEVD